jgi:hypothetical protein
MNLYDEIFETEYDINGEIIADESHQKIDDIYGLAYDKRAFIQIMRDTTRELQKYHNMFQEYLDDLIEPRIFCPKTDFNFDGTITAYKLYKADMLEGINMDPLIEQLINKIDNMIDTIRTILDDATRN